MSCRKRIVQGTTLCVLGALAGLTGCSATEDGRAGATRTTDEALSVASASGSTAGSTVVRSAGAAAAPLTAAPAPSDGRAHGKRHRRLRGALAQGKSPREAAERFRVSHLAGLGEHPEELIAARSKYLAKPGRSQTNTSDAVVEATVRTTEAAKATSEEGIGLMYNPATGKYKFRLFTYQQQRDGVPVFGGGMRTLVRDGGDNAVVWANSDVRALGSFRAKLAAPLRSVDTGRSLEALRRNAGRVTQAIPLPKNLGQVSSPTPIVYAGVGTDSVSPRMAMQYSAGNVAGPGRWTFVADATTGEILHIESNLQPNVTGTVKGEVIIGNESGECGVLGTLPLPYAEVTSSEGSAFADASGAFSLAQSGSTPVNLVSTVKGKFFNVVDAQGTHSMSRLVTPPGPADFVHRDFEVPQERVLAQLNAYKAANELRDMLLQYAPEFPGISTETSFQINVNLAVDMCDWMGGAWHDSDVQPATINFCLSSEARPKGRVPTNLSNAAFGSIVHHEYGHHIIDSAGSGQREYGEGMADTIAALVAKDPRYALGYYAGNCSTPLRDGSNACQYHPTDCSSCGSGVYECGGMLTATIWDIWKRLDLTEPTRSNDIIRSLVFSSIPMHSGTGINESIAVDMLTLDDDDGVLENGTPHYAEICGGFAAHGMQCPPLAQGCTSDAQCDDGRYCNGAETCANQACVSGTPVTCNDGNACTDDACSDATGCSYSNNTASCADDGNQCTSDSCSAGACTHPSNGSCTTQGPCTGFCANPIKFSGNRFQSGDLGSSATCHETTAALASGSCGNFTSPRRLLVNGVEMKCNWAPWASLPATKDGGYCIQTTSGNPAWAYFNTW